MLPAVAAMIVQNTANSINNLRFQMLCLKRGIFVPVDKKPELTDLGKRCLELVSKDRVEIRRAIYDVRVAELKAKGITRPSEILKHTMDMW